MIEITIDDLHRYCPAAVTPDDVLFDKLGSYITDSLAEVSAMLGPAMIGRMDAADVDDDRDTALCAMVSAAKKAVCADALWRAVPQLDLVYTETGFGVVSNDHVAPASADRVNRLRAALRHDYCQAVDTLIYLARPFEEWNNTEAAHTQICSLIWNPKTLRSAGFATADRDTLAEYRPAITEAETILAEKISPELLVELTALLRRAADFSAVQVALLFVCRQFICDMIKNGCPNSDILRNVMLVIDSAPDEFSTYFNSATYAARKSQNYENRKNDPCYFF